MLTPAESFRKSDYAKGWLTFVDSKQFESAASAALLEMALANRRTDDLGSSAGAQKKMEGAMAFLGILMTLTLPAPAQRPLSTTDNLDHRV